MIRPLVAAKEYLLLPDRISKFEHGYLLRLNRIATILFLCHLPVFIAIAYFNETGPLLATALTSAVLLGPLLASRVFQSQRAISVVHGFTMVLMCGLLIHFCQGPIQIEMHFYFFVGCTLLSVFGNPMVILAALLAIAVHHFGLFYLLPESAWNYEPSVLVLMTHIVFAALAAASGVFNSRTFYNSIVQLEQRVDEQTKVVGARNRDIGMILQSVEQGFLTIERDGRVHHERSASVDRLLGEIGPDETLIEAVARHDEKFASWLEFGLGEVFEGVLPPEVAVDQLPTQLTANGRILSLQSYPLLVDDTVSNLKVVVTDVTAELEKQKLETETREMLSLIDRYATDPNGVIEFFRESGKIIEELRSESRDDVVLVRRRLHTLKGNAATFGLTRLSDCCHSLEDENFELQATPDDAKWTELLGCWASARGHLRRMSNSESADYRLTDEQHQALLLGLLRRDPPEALASTVASWRLEPTDYRLHRLGQHARDLAKRLGKGEILLSIQSNALCLESEQWSDFWTSLVHVIRNAVDHGLEDREERLLAKKSDSGRLTLSTQCDANEFVVSVSDDGRGIDWDRSAECATERGMPADDQTDLTDAIFIDGVTTAPEVNVYSGRGVGMAALKQSCQALDGTIEVQSENGKGTTFEFHFPRRQMAPHLSKLFADHGFALDIKSVLTSSTI